MTNIAACILLSALAATNPATRPAPIEDSFRHTITKTLELKYLVYLPEDYHLERRYPLIIFLHGSGECGNDLGKLKGRGLIQFMNPGMPFIIVVPQARSELDWWQPEMLNPMLDDVLAKYSVDADRVYLTGVSMGAYGVWDWACHNPERFAAIAPLAGEGNDDLARRLKHVPVWAFHGALDAAVSLQEEQRMVHAVTRIGGDAKLTIYPDGKHDIWPRTYRNPELYEWFLKQRRWKQAATTRQAN